MLIKEKPKNVGRLFVSYTSERCVIGLIVATASADSIWVNDSAGYYDVVLSGRLLRGIIVFDHEILALGDKFP